MTLPETLSCDPEYRALEIGKNFLAGIPDGTVVDVQHACPTEFPALPEVRVGGLEALEAYWCA